MDLLWSWDGAASVRDVQRAMAADRPLAYTTLMTVLDRLHSKGWLTRELDGRAYRYRPSASREEYSAGLMAQTLDDSPNRSSVLVRFVQQLDEDEIERLRSALRSTDRRRGGRKE